MGKFSSNRSVESLNKIFALVSLPLSISKPPDTKLIPAPASPLLINTILSLTFKLVVLTIVSIPVTVKLLMVTKSVKVLSPAIA